MGRHGRTRDIEVTVEPSDLSDGAREIDYRGQCLGKGPHQGLGGGRCRLGTK